MSLRVRLPNPLVVLDDRALLTRFAEDRDQQAFEQLVKRHGGLVFGVCKRMVRDSHLAEDAFQAVFLVLARNPRDALTAASVGGWLFGVARRVGLAARRHEHRREKHARRAGGVRPLLEQQHANPPSDFGDLLRVLDEELAALPEEFRAALVACFLEERTQDEAARELNWSLSTLRRRLDRGKELLRGRLSRRGVTLAAGLFTCALATPVRAAVPALAPPTSPSPMSAALAAEAVRSGLGAKLVAACAVAVLAAGGLAFGFSQDSPEQPNPFEGSVRAAEPAPMPDTAPAPHAVETKPWVSVSGRVVFPKDRAIPELKPVLAKNIKDAEEWRPFLPLYYEETVVRADNRGIANVVVFLRPDSDDRKAEFPAEKVHPELAKAKPTTQTVAAAGGQFAPRVLAVRSGDRVTFDNRLPVPTNVLFRPPPEAVGEEFNVLIGKGMAHTSKPLTATHLPVLYTSSIYPWMRGYVWAFDHPYFAVTDATGRFEIKNAPAGKWRLVAWQETAGWLGGAPGRLGTKLTIPESRTGKLELDPLTFTSDNWPK
jgi:RNA polymerase sigma factor (sigma-70 family)